MSWHGRTSFWHLVARRPLTISGNRISSRPNREGLIYVQNSNAHRGPAHRLRRSANHTFARRAVGLASHATAAVGMNYCFEGRQLCQGRGYDLVSREGQIIPVGSRDQFLRRIGQPVRSTRKHLGRLQMSDQLSCYWRYLACRSPRCGAAVRRGRDREPAALIARLRSTQQPATVVSQAGPLKSIAVSAGRQVGPENVKATHRECKNAAVVHSANSSATRRRCIPVRRPAGCPLQRGGTFLRPFLPPRQCEVG